MYSLIRERVADKGVLFISHRLSVCRIVDEILVFENGTIVQRGSHKKLFEAEDGFTAGCGRHRRRFGCEIFVLKIGRQGSD